jgi:hypothetical protein
MNGSKMVFLVYTFTVDIRSEEDLNSNRRFPLPEVGKIAKVSSREDF